MPLDIKCQNYPTEKQLRFAARKFGEGFTWTCCTCGEQLILTQGKGNYWYWKKLQDILRGE